MRILSAVLLLILLVPSAMAQVTSGVITGNVFDSSGLSIAGADVVLTSETTGATWKTATDTLGVFNFTSILPGKFTLAVEAKGFKQYRATGVTLTANEKLSVGTISLAVGAVTESVTVTAEATPVQTASQERSAVLNDRQMADLSIRGRDFLNLMKLMPGVANAGTGGEVLSQTSTPTVQGIRSEYNTVSLDGVVASTGGNGVNNQPMNMDSIAEVKVLLGNYQAEYGRNSGAIINAVTKSGTRDFHGTGYYYKRHEQFNANNFFNNQRGVVTPRYRYNTWGYNVGGPIYIPGKFNTDKSKLFFFWSQEYLPVTTPGPTRTVTVPTALERNGDFTQTTDVGGTLIAIKDPTTGLPFAGNVVPTSRINTNIQKMFNVFPAANFTNIAVSGRNYNYVLADSYKMPTKQYLLRTDYNINQKLRTYLRGQTYSVDYNGTAGVPGNSMTWLSVPVHYKLTGPQATAAFNYIASPTLVNDFLIGFSANTEHQFLDNEADLSKISKTGLGMTLGQNNPANNPLNLIPASSYSGVPNAAGTGFDGRFPMGNYSNGWTLADGLTKVLHSHTIKVGAFTERFLNDQPHHAGSVAASGSFAFGKDVNNPLDANYAYANAILGNFSSYTEASNLVNYSPKAGTYEFYVQDSWRVSKKLTLEYGVRFTHAPPFTWKTNQASNLALERWDRSKAPVLFVPAFNAQNVRVAMDPKTGTLFPAVYIGKIVPGSGDPANGSVLATDNTYPSGFSNVPVLAPAPRLGFAYDPFGDGKTAIRGGFGMFYNARPRGGQAGDMSFNPPTIYTATQYYNNVSTFLGATGVLNPTGWNRVIQKDAAYVQSYQMHFGIQRKIGFGTVVDVAYSGTLGRHLGETHDINVVPYGARFLTQNIDPTTKTALPDNFFRPYPGYAGIPYYAFDANSSYHSMQVQVNRRFSHGLQYGVAYTWSKAMDYTDSYNGTLATYLSWKVWNYGKAGFDQTHVFVGNWLYDIPRLARNWDNEFSRQLLAGWKLSGIMTMASGNPVGISYTTTDGADITGGGDGSRVFVTGLAILPKSERTITRFFNPSVFARPAVGSIGAAPKDVYRGPGINNWDLTLFKIFPIKDKAQVQFRWEAYNAFNHTQFSGVNSAATFNAAGVQQNALFGQITSARDPRIMQLALRLSF
jgi:hypothetical protein